MWTVTMGFKVTLKKYSCQKNKVTLKTQGNSESRKEVEVTWEGWERVSQVFPK